MTPQENPLEKGKARRKRNRATVAYKASRAKYMASPRGKAAAKKYLKGPRGKAVCAARFANAHAKRLGLTDRLTTQQVFDLFQSQTACQECGTDQDLTMDHIAAFANGGPNVIENCQVLCNYHNNSKGARR